MKIQKLVMNNNDKSQTTLYFPKGQLYPTFCDVMSLKMQTEYAKF